jgi:hypothetical protein
MNVDGDKLNEYLTDVIAYFARMENASYEPEDQGRYRHTRYTLEAMQKQIDEGVFS